MITRVLDADGNVLHDCAQSNCAVSWDGVIIDAERYALDIEEMPKRVAARVSATAKDERVTDAVQPDKSMWDVRGETARLRTRAES